MDGGAEGDRRFWSEGGGNGRGSGTEDVLATEDAEDFGLDCKSDNLLVEDASSRRVFRTPETVLLLWMSPLECLLKAFMTSSLEKPASSRWPIC